jgi:hypothetical protein
MVSAPLQLKQLKRGKKSKNNQESMKGGLCQKGPRGGELARKIERHVDKHKHIVVAYSSHFLFRDIIQGTKEQNHDRY